MAQSANAQLVTHEGLNNDIFRFNFTKENLHLTNDISDAMVLKEILCFNSNSPRACTFWYIWQYVGLGSGYAMVKLGAKPFHQFVIIQFIAAHYSDAIMGAMASQITSLTIVYSTVYSGADQRKHQSSSSLTFVRGIHRWPVNSPHKWTVTRKMFPFDDIIMLYALSDIHGSPSPLNTSIQVWFNFHELYEF